MRRMSDKIFLLKIFLDFSSLHTTLPSTYDRISPHERRRMIRLNHGDEAPDFEARTDQNQTLRLSALRGQTVILYFYPQDDTPG